MRIFFVAAGSPATVFALAPLATAAKNAGHQVLMAANDAIIDSVSAVGLAGVPATDRPLMEFITQERSGAPAVMPADADGGALFTGRWFGRLALAHRDRLRELVSDWRPDLIIGGTMCYAGDLLAAELGVPYVRQAWDAIDARRVHVGAAQELRAELAELGLTELPPPAMFVDVCPPSLGPAPGGQPMRWIPGNRQRPVQPWMFRRAAEHRICLTAGTRIWSTSDPGYVFLREVGRRLASEPVVELLIGASEDIAEQLRADVPGARVGWLPIDLLAPTCDLILHHGGGTTTLTTLAAGVPQLVWPQGGLHVAGAQAVVEQGAALAVTGDGVPDPDEVAAGCQELVADPRYRKCAESIAAEIAAMPLPADVVGMIEQL